MGKISTGWQITKQSLHVIKHDKEIVLFPILSFIITLGLGALFFFLFLLPSLFAPELYEGSSIFNVTFFTLSFVFLIVVYFVNIYFEAAIISSAMIRFSGKNPTFGEGLAGPSKRVHALFIWAIINAVIAVILNILQNLGRRGGRGTQIGVDMARSLFGMAWNLLTFFVIPLIVLEKESPFASISRSKDLFKKTWGENITAQLSAGGIIFIFAIPAIALIILGALAGGVIASIGISIGILWLAILMVLATSVNGIIKAALYHYATTSKMPQVYSPEVSQAMTLSN